MSNSKTKSKKVGIFVEFNYEDLELWYPLLRFREEGFETFTIGPQKGMLYKSKNGYGCKADFSIDEVSEKDLAGLVIPGGWAPDYWRRDQRFVDLTRHMVNSGKPVGAICRGGSMLCSARVLQGRKVTGLCAIKDDLENAGAIYEDSPVVVDGNLVTSRLPQDLPYFCPEFLKLLKK